MTECLDLVRDRGRARLWPDPPQNGQIWTLLTTMVELKGHEEKAGFTRPLGAGHGVNPGAKTWKELRDEEAEQLGYKTQPYVLIIGGGQGGIALGARLRQLGVPTIIVEKNERAGDSWRNRYKSLCLHDPVWYDHLPYIDFPKNWPVFSPKDKIGDWLEMYTKVMELNYWTEHHGQARQMGRRQEGMDRRRRARRQGDHAPAEAAGVRDRHVGQAEHAAIQGHGHLQGRAAPFLAPSRPRRATRARRCVVIGSNNSAHDICAALYEAGVDVTMVQRSTPISCARTR